MLVLIAIAVSYHKKGTPTDLSVMNATTSDQNLLPIDKEYQAVLPTLNPTEKFSRDLISNIIAAQPTNGPIDQNTSDAIVQNAISEIPQNSFQGTITVANLNIIPINDSTFSRDAAVYAYDYFLSMKTLLSVFGQDAALISNAQSSGSPLDTDKLNSIITTYQLVINTLVKIPIPANPDSSIVSYHLNIINGLETLIQIDTDIVNATSSQALSVFSNLPLYNSTISNLTTSMDALNNILKPQN